MMRMLNRVLQLGLWALALSSLTAALACYVSYRRDCARLANVASDVTAGLNVPDDRVSALLEWVHGLHGSAGNRGRFLLTSMRATPLQVIESGGDCADKSRLLYALLRESGMSATMALCFKADSNEPVHTFVEVALGAGCQMAVDPAFNLFFPKPDETGYYGLLDLRKDPAILVRRVETICREIPTQCREQYYMRPADGYTRASTINWNKNAVLRLTHHLLHSVLGDEVYRLRRPAVIEEPKLFVAALCVVSAGACLMVLRVARRRATRKIVGFRIAARRPLPTRA